MNSSEYNSYYHAILAANDAKATNVLKNIKDELISKYGTNDNDVTRLLNYFKFHV